MRGPRPKRRGPDTYARVRRAKRARLEFGVTGRAGRELVAIARRYVAERRSPLPARALARVLPEWMRQARNTLAVAS